LGARLTAFLVGPEGRPLAWTLRGYDRATSLRGDVVAGVTVAALIIPLSVGYAGVAGLPPEVGLYASLLPLVAYAIFGSVRTLIVGPDAATAALVGATIAPLAVASDDRVRLAGVLAILVAATFVAMRWARLGFLADFLSRPILVGYMTGVGIDVALRQIPKILGGDPIGDALAVLSRIDILAVGPATAIGAALTAARDSGVNGPSIVIGGLVFAVVMWGGRLLPRVPLALPAIVAALIASVAFDLQARGVEILGPVKPGLPTPGIPVASVSELVALAPGAIGIALLSFCDTALTGRNFASRRREHTDPDRELVALAAADVAGGLTSGYPISSSPSRTAAAEAAGASTQLTGLIAAGVVALVLVLLTGPMAYLPQPALGAVILASVLKFIDLLGIREIWRTRPSEGVIAAAATGGVLLYGTLAGVGIAVLLAALNVVRRAAWPQVDELRRLPDGRGFADTERWPDAERVEGVVVVRFAGPLFFANVGTLVDRIRSLGAAADVQAVVLDLGTVSDIDLTAAGALRELADDFEERGVAFGVARPTGHVRDLMRLEGIGDLLGPTGEAPRTIEAAIAALPVAAATDAAVTDAPVPDAVPDAAAAGVAASQPAEHPGDGLRASVERWLLALVGIAVLGIVGFVLLQGLGRDPDGGPAPSPGTAIVPNVVGMSLGQATAALDGRGFALGEPVYVILEGRPEGTVVAQDPVAGTTAAAGAPVTPTVSTSRPLVVIPDVTGQPEADAVATLATSGLVVGRVDRAPHQTVPAGLVVSTIPEAGTEVADGTRVDVSVSTGPAPSPSPELPPSTPGVSRPPSLESSPSPSSSASTPPSPSPQPSPSPPPQPAPTGSPPPSGSTAPSPTADPSPSASP
jgi:high affinity sulfate transporter 1